MHKKSRLFIFFSKVLLDHKADPNRKNKFGMTPMQHAAVAGSADVISCLIAAGAKANLADDQRRLPLHWAAGKNKKNIYLYKNATACILTLIR